MSREGGGERVLFCFLTLDQAPVVSCNNGHHFILDLARHLFIRQKPRFILFIMPSLGPSSRPPAPPSFGFLPAAGTTALDTKQDLDN